MAKLIVSDTTAILHLAKIGEVNILKRLYTQILRDCLKTKPLILLD